MSVVAVVPSRGRPDRALEVVEALRERAHLVGTTVVLAVDRDDPEHAEYARLLTRRRAGTYRAEVELVSLEPEETGNLVKATNTVSLRIAEESPDSIIGNLGDDHVCRTDGWDKLVTEALAEPGIAYGRDGIHNEHMPTAPFISAKVVRGLGWYALPTCYHTYIDNVWFDVAEALGIRRYIPELLIEHMHPAVLKSAMDEGYRRMEATYVHDHEAYEEWKLKWMPLDVLALRQALGE